MKLKTLQIVIACVLLFSTCTAIAHAQIYVITDLGSLTPVAINTWGQVVGNDKNQAYIWTEWGGRRALGTLPAGTFTSAAAINDFGMVTGTADGQGIAVSPSPSFQNQDCSDLIQPFVWRSLNGMQGLGSVATEGDLLYPFTWCSDPFYGTAINDLDQVVGYDGGYDTNQYVFLRTGSAGMSAFGGSWPPTSANGISNSGLIVGQNSTDSTYGVGHATSWENGVTIDLGTLGAERMF